MSLHIDHIYTLVADRQGAAAALRRRGFDLTDAGVHMGRGTSNHLAIFLGPYWEILALDEALPVNRHLQQLLATGAGLLGCALATQDIEADSARLRQRGIDVAKAQDVARPINADRSGPVARFRVAQIEPPTGFAASFFFCQHLTPELVWPSPLPSHPNGAIEIVGLTVVARDPQTTARELAGLFESEIDEADGRAIQVGRIAVDCITPAGFARRYPGARWDFDGTARFAGLTMRVPDIGDGTSVPLSSGASERTIADPDLGQMTLTWSNE